MSLELDGLWLPAEAVALRTAVPRWAGATGIKTAAHQSGGLRRWRRPPCPCWTTRRQAPCAPAWPTSAAGPTPWRTSRHPRRGPGAAGGAGGGVRVLRAATTAAVVAGGGRAMALTRPCPAPRQGRAVPAGPGPDGGVASGTPAGTGRAAVRCGGEDR
ncbi:hypothetical protein LT493_42775 [Streptomyces tricolor]|nr:hypothetical protein [Streptomyces tricolor]